MYLSLTKMTYADTFSVGIYPPITKINAIPPVNTTSPIVIKNPTDKTEVLNITFRPFTQSDEENGQVRFLKSDELNLEDPLIFQRIKITDQDKEVSSITLAPKEERKLKLSLDIPEGENVSDYYFSILFTSTSSALLEQKNTSQIESSIATNILLSIGKPQKPNIQISEFSTSLLKNKGPVEFKVKTQNLNKSFTSVHGFITIKDLFGHLVGRIELKNVNLLASGSRIIPSQNEISTVTWKEKFLMGPYQANLTLVAGDNEKIINKTIFFIGTPLQFVATLCAIVLFLGLTIKRLKSRHNR